MVDDLPASHAGASDRPSDAAELLRQLDACAVQGDWTERDAAGWWAARRESAQAAERALAVTADQTAAPKPPPPDITMACDGDTNRP